MLEEAKPRFTKEKITILALWFGVLIGVRILLGYVLVDMWMGTIGAVGITFAIFYLSLRFTPLQKYRAIINSSLALWYRKKFFYITGAISMFLLGSILFTIEYGHANYEDRLITMDMTQEEFDETLMKFGGDEGTGRNLAENLNDYSALEIISITLASADKNFDGYYSKVVSYMFAEDIEIMIFMLLFRTRREIFTAPNLK
jgi:hypothetical protein